jgi:twitching motility two-component system response regulator PilH
MIDFFKRRSSAVNQPSATEGSAATVLIVDDSPTETMIMRNALIKAGFRVETAVNGQEGVEAAQRQHPDLILMDVIMPILNGFQATRMLQRDAATAGIPVIMVTTKDQVTDRSWGLRQGAVDYLVKPVNPEELIQRIRAALGA